MTYDAVDLALVFGSCLGCFMFGFGIGYWLRITRDLNSAAM